MDCLASNGDAAGGARVVEFHGGLASPSTLRKQGVLTLRGDVLAAGPLRLAGIREQCNRLLSRQVVGVDRPSPIGPRSLWSSETCRLAVGKLCTDGDSKPMRIVIFGAAGATGRLLTEAALQAGHHVTAAVRSVSEPLPRHPLLRVVHCDALDQRSVSASLSGQEVALCALGASRGGESVYSLGARNIVLGMAEHGVRRVVFLSNFGVLGERGTGLRTRALSWLVRHSLRATLVHHRQAIDILRASGREWVAVRPMVLTNGVERFAYRTHLTDLPTRATHVSRADLARFMLQSVESDTYLYQIPSIAY